MTEKQKSSGARRYAAEDIRHIRRKERENTMSCRPAAGRCKRYQ